MEMGYTGPTPCQIDKWNCEVFINIEKYKIVFKIRKYHMKIFVFLMAYKASVLSKFTSMQDLESNDWIILDPLGNIYEIYANLTVVTLLNLNHF